MQLSICLRWPGGNHHGLGFTDQGCELLGIGGAQINKLNLSVGLADAVGDRLTEPVTEAVLTQITDGRITFAFIALPAPFAVIVDPVAEVVAKQRAMTYRDRVDLGQTIHPLKGLKHAAGIRPHQAVVIETEIRSDGARIAVKDVFRAVVQPKGIAGVKDATAMVKRKNRVWPVQVGCT